MMPRTTSRIRLRHAASAGIMACSLTALAGAYTWFNVGGVDVVWPGGQSVRSLSPVTFPPGSETETLYLAAMGLWNLVPACNFEYFYETNPQEFPLDNFDGYNDTVAVPYTDLDPGTLGVTYLVNNGAQWFDMDMAFADVPVGVGWTFDTNPDCTVISDPDTHGFSFLLVATHELGHALGLGHDPVGDESPGTPWFIATMNPRYPSGGPVGDQHIVELHTDDRAGARYLYPSSGPSGDPLVDLANVGYTAGPDLGKAIPVFFDPPAVDPGADLTLRSVIENFGTTNEFFVRQGFYLSTNAIISPGDLLLDSVLWDLAFEDGFDFDVIITLPDDLAAGEYTVGSFLDDLGEVTEEYEDNNIVTYCDLLTVNQLPPVVNPLGQEIIAEGTAYVGPSPSVTRPLNAAPLTWSIDFAPAGMTINPSTGVLHWPDPVANPFLYVIQIRATNDAGFGTQQLFLGVEEFVPTCPWDFDDSGQVGTADFFALLQNWGLCPAAPAACPWDVSGDDAVGTADFFDLLQHWGPCE
jgi:hypothetical protein